MRIHFQKYEATGNDFILIDNRAYKLTLSLEQIRQLCNRKLGIGADGLILIEPHPSSDFNLVYYNSDGSCSLCGNGSRAGIAMAASLHLFNDSTLFNAYDGVHNGALLPNNLILLTMNPVYETKKIIIHRKKGFFINTGSPHFIQTVAAVKNFSVQEKGRKIRYHDAFNPAGTNVNFVELLPDNTLFVRTYERGVEDETLSCGTGVTAAALAASFWGYYSPIKIRTLGGELSVSFTAHPDGTFTDISLIGPAQKVFEGEIDL